MRRWEEPGEGRKQKERERLGKSTQLRLTGGPQQPELSGPELSGPEPGGSSPGAGRAHAVPGARVRPGPQALAGGLRVK